MEAAHRSWSEGTYTSRPAEETVTTTISVSPADLAALEAINDAIAERNETTGSTRGTPGATSEVTRPSFTNAITRGATEAITNFGKGFQSFLDKWFGRETGETITPEEESSATTTTSYAPQNMILRAAHFIASTPVANAQTIDDTADMSVDSKPNLFERFIEWLFGSDDTVETYTDLHIETVPGSSSSPYIPVFIRIDEYAHTIHLSRG